MKNLFFMFLVGCSSVQGQYYSLVDTDTNTGTDTDISTDVDSDEDSGEVFVDSGSDSGAESDAGEDSGVVGYCDSGSCCSDGVISLSGAPCVPDVFPEDVAEEFAPGLDVPLQFRCTDPDVCGGGEERRVGSTVCDGESSSCFLENIVWGPWETTISVSPDPSSVCDPVRTSGVVWAPVSWVGASFYSCASSGYSGCENGACVPVFTGEDCSYNYSDFYCGSCDNNCFENGGSQCGGGGGDYFCTCGATGVACDEGQRCIFDYIVYEYTCIPE